MPVKKYKTDKQAKKARTRRTNKYHTRAMKSYSFRFHKVSDAEVIDRLEDVTNKCDYIRQLILNDIKKRGN